MALVKMRKLTLLAFSDDRKKILRALSKTRCTEIKNTEQSDILTAIDCQRDRDLVSQKIAKYAGAINLFKDNKREITKFEKAFAKIKKYPTFLLAKNASELLYLTANKQLIVKPMEEFLLLEKSGEKTEDTSLALIEKPMNKENGEQNQDAVGENNDKKSHYGATTETELVLLENRAVVSTFEFEKKPLIAPIQRIQFEEFEAIIEREQELDDVISEISGKNQKINELNSEINKIKNQLENLQPFIDVDCSFDMFVDTKSASAVLGTIPTGKIDAAREIIAAHENCIVEIFERNKVSALAFVCGKGNKEEMLTALNACDFAKSNYYYPLTAAEKTDELMKNLFEIKSQIVKLNYEIAFHAHRLDEIKRLFDFYTLERQKIEAQDKCGATGKTFLLEAWLPHDREEQVSGAINSIESTVAFEFSDATENEIVPSLTANNNFVAPYEAVTNMYSIPDPNEIDPNPFVAIFFFIFYGVMMSDAGYGLILTIISFVLIKILKPRKGEAKVLFIILMGGISTIFWGIMFGGFFAIEAPWIKPILFNPLENPLPMLGLSLGLGVFQIMFGMGIQAYAFIKAGKFWDAVFDIFSWYFIFVGIGLMALNLVLKVKVLMTVGIVMMCVGAGLLIIFGGRKKKGVGRLLGGFGKFYGIMNFMSDILSYSRLFGLGLATGVVGMVVNKIGVVIIDMIPIFGIVVAIPVFLIGHIFNISINTLGAYVHNCRLQYIEFFSRFYTGAGHQFVPLATNIKYTKID